MLSIETLDIRQYLNFQSSRIKNRYDQKVKQIDFRGQKSRALKLQSNWEGLYRIVKKLNDVVFRIQKSARHRLKVVHADRLALFEEKK